MMINDVNMKKFLFIVALFVQQIDVLAVTVERTVNLNVYYPEYTKIDLVCEQMPKAAQNSALHTMGKICRSLTTRSLKII